MGKIEENAFVDIRAGDIQKIKVQAKIVYLGCAANKCHIAVYTSRVALPTYWGSLYA